MGVGLSLRGAEGPAGPPGATGQDAVAISDAVRGQVDRYYREVGGVLSYTGSGFAARNDAYSRPQNIDQVATDSSQITVTHEEIGARALMRIDAKVGPNLRAAGFTAEATANLDLQSTDIVLRQNHRLVDALTNAGDGTPWIAELGVASPFTLTGLTNVSANFASYVQGLANIAGHWRLSEASGAVLDDAVGANDGAVVGTPTAYAVTGGLPSDGVDKAITTSGVATSDLTLPLAGITQAAFSVVMRLKCPPATTMVLRDHTSVTNSYYIAEGAGFITYRIGSVGYSTSTAWSALANSNWHTLVLTKNGATVALYLDGVQIHTAATAPTTALTSPWHVGRNGATTPYFAVTLSEFASFSRALTAGEVTGIQNVVVTDGLLHVTHTDVGSTKSSEITLKPQTDLRPLLVPGSVTATGFDVQFLDAAGAPVVIADADMALGLAREVFDAPVDPTALSVPVIVQKTGEWDADLRATGPILYARLGEASGTSFNDEIGTNDGTSQATVTLGATGAVVGDANHAVTLDGAQGKIAFGNPARTGQFSFSIFFKRTGAGTVGAPDFSTILGWSTSRRVMVGSDGSLYFAMGGQVVTTPAGTAPTGEWHHLVYTWDGATQSAILNGELVISNVTASVGFNSAFWLGSYLATSTNYSFKGDLDEFVIWDRALLLAEAQQLYTDAFDTALSVDRASDSQIELEGLFETLAPPPDADQQAAPTATALPAGDVGGAVACYESLAPYRAAGLLDFGPSSPWCHRPLPDTQPERDAIELNGLAGFPNATSTNWVTDFCHMYGIDPSTGATVLTQPGGGALQGGSTPLYLRVLGEFIYVVPDTQPLRMLLDRSDAGNWQTQMNAVYAALGGLPLPADAMPHATADRYAFVFQPTTQTWFQLYGWIPQIAEEATSTMELTGAPTSGGFFLEFDYIDPVNQAVQTFFTQTPIVYNDTAASIEAKMNAAKTTSGATFAASGTRNSADAVACSGGPLNVSPVTCAFQIALATQPVGMRFSNNFLNVGGVHFTYSNADPWSWVYFSSVTSPDVAGDHVPLPGSGTSGGTSAATGIDWMPMIIDWDEYNTAYEIGMSDGWDAAGTDLGHVIAMTIGNCGQGFVWPALRGDGTFSNADRSRIVEGCLMTLPLDADDSKVDDVFMPIHNTFKRYGIMPIDKSGGGCELLFRNPIWPGITRPFPGPSGFQFTPAAYTAYMRQIRWDQMQIIDPVEVQAGW